jgi:hypothetical protein
MAVLNRKIILAPVIVALLTTGGVVRAQEAKELPIHPDRTIKFDVKFDGPDAAKITAVSVTLHIPNGHVPDNQIGFSPEVNGDQASIAPDKHFYPEVTIRNTTASGSYELLVSVFTNTGRFTYTAGNEFPLHVFHVENPATFTPPHITVKELP